VNNTNKKLQKKHQNVKSNVEKYTIIYNECNEKFEILRNKFSNNKYSNQFKKVSLHSSVKSVLNNAKETCEIKIAPEDPIDIEMSEDIAEHKKILRAQEQEIDKGLDRLKSSVGRLKDTALNIGTTLDAQNNILDNTENKVDTSNNDLSRLNRRLSRINRSSIPINRYVTAMCCLLLIGIVSYFAYTFFN